MNPSVLRDRSTPRLGYVYHRICRWDGRPQQGGITRKIEGGLAGRTLGHVVAKLRSARGQADHDYKNVFSKALSEIEQARSADVSKARTLIVGCGYTYPDVTLWSTVASHAVGVDVRKTFLRNGFGALYRESRRSGDGVVKALGRTMLNRGSNSSYYRHLRRSSGRALDEQSQDLIAYDGTRLPFADESFDIVLSNAVLEHVADLDRVSDELRRVTRPGGIGYHIWHNYYSLSGAHVTEGLASSKPWGHLMGDPEVAEWLRFTGTYLNKKTPNEIAGSLSRNFVQLRVNRLDANHRREGLDPDYAAEGAGLMTPALEKKLARYPKDVLLTRAYSFMGIRR